MIKGFRVEGFGDLTNPNQPQVPEWPLLSVWLLLLLPRLPFPLLTRYPYYFLDTSPARLQLESPKGSQSGTSPTKPLPIVSMGSSFFWATL